MLLSLLLYKLCSALTLLCMWQLPKQRNRNFYVKEKPHCFQTRAMHRGYFCDRKWSFATWEWRHRPCVLIDLRWQLVPNTRTVVDRLHYCALNIIKALFTFPYIENDFRLKIWKYKDMKTTLEVLHNSHHEMSRPVHLCKRHVVIGNGFCKSVGEWNAIKCFSSSFTDVLKMED